MNIPEMAERLGLDGNALAQGKTLESTVEIGSVDEFRALFADHLTDEQRAGFAKGSRQAPADDAPGMTQMVDHVFGNGALTPQAAAHAEALFPVKVQIVMGRTVTIDSDRVVGPGASPYAVIADTLIFKGGSLTVKSTALTIKAGTLSIQQGNPSKNAYHVGIFGVDGTIGAKGADGPPYKDPAKDGANASPPTPGICTGAGNGGDGAAGSKGQGGGPGVGGNPGSASFPATLLVSSFDPASVGAFIVETKSAAGGPGGPGGKGGPGQDGGSGGHGCDSGCEGTDGGNGGPAGPGGDGGPGGNGTDGINGYPIAITFPNIAKNFLQTVAQQAAVGAFGPGGPGGPPGNPGAPGKGGKHKRDGTKGGGAGDGSLGAKGTAGTQPGQPGPITSNFT